MERRRTGRVDARRTPLTAPRKIALVLAGTVAGLLLAEGALRAGGFAYSARQEARNERSLAEGGEYRILCVGESTTAMGGDYAYPHQLERILDARELGVDVAVINEGIPGTTSAHIVATFPDTIRRYQPQMVVAMIGINDPRDHGEECAPGPLAAWFRGLRLYKAVTRPWPMLGRRPLPKDNTVMMIEAENEQDAVSARKEERALLKRLRADPDDHGASADLAELLIRTGRHDEALQRLEDALPRAGDHAGLLAARADLAWSMNDPRGAGAWYDRALAAEPGHAEASLELGRIAKQQGRRQRAKQLLEAGHRIHPDDTYLATELAELLAGEGRPEEALAVLRTALAYGSDDTFPYVVAAELLCGLGRYDEAEALAADARLVAANDSSVNMRLNTCYQEAGELARATVQLETLIAREPGHSGLHRELSEVLRRRGDLEGAAVALEQASDIEAELCPTATRDSYQALLDYCELYGIELVAAQYPRRNVIQLQRMFDPGQAVLLVDNQRSFEEAVARYGFSDLFIDRFAGDFGHATPRGNRLLAEGVADAVEGLVREQVTAAVAP
ncbi:MAG: hypothetical protein CMJ87_13135 [Planctomycetes bacterium]|jgi:tetratricopeptide (TPR) repeat protein|nr:hypothetical protein [Planctomycetota bacterium]